MSNNKSTGKLPKNDLQVVRGLKQLSGAPTVKWW